MNFKLSKVYQDWSKNKEIFLLMRIGSLGQTVAGWNDDATVQEVTFNEYPQFTFFIKNDFLNTLDN